jgi:dihydroorotate dehydrogenase (fumarate)
MSDSSIDLSTTYLGLRLKNPLVPSASPLSRDLCTLRKLEEHGASAVVMFSLFEEEIEHQAAELNHYLSQGTESYSEALSYLPEDAAFTLGPEEYLKHLQKAKEAVRIPVIASLNGVTPGGWTRYAKRIEEAGADALELNVYYIPTDPAMDGRAVEDRYVEVLQAVKSEVKIPVAMKLSPYFSSVAAMARRLEGAGADGLVLFNRFYQPDLDLENREVFPNLKLSSSVEIRLPLRWIAILYDRVGLSLAATSGVEAPADVIKLLMVGADVTMVCSTLLRNGPGRIRELLEGVEEWMEEHEYQSVEELKGCMSHRFTGDPSAFERANYMRALNTYL